MKNNLLMIIVFSCITLSIQPASKWKALLKSPYSFTARAALKAKQRELDDEDKKEKRAISGRRQIPFQQAEKPKFTFQEESPSWRERLNKWWNSWFYPQK
jgi:hypothetical protein